MSHNDLTIGNILRMDDGKIVFIDFEYGGANYRGYDLGIPRKRLCLPTRPECFPGCLSLRLAGNHFNEFAGLGCDFSRYPSLEVQRRYARHYLASSSFSHRTAAVSFPPKL